MSGESDNKYMQRCLDLAMKAEGYTYPNPLVGAVVVCEDLIAGEGYHLYAGGAHAEVTAINAVRNRDILSRSTLYVSLEPCCHHGKTPPCTDLIISSGIQRIVAGTIDTSMKVSGKGIELLRKAGKEVTVGVMEKECRRVNRRFFTYNEKMRPYIILKWAEGADGFIDTERTEGSSPEPYWITGLAERVLVHRWRASEEAILVGGETIRKDKPKLNVRYWKGQDPVRVILSRSGNLGNYLSNNEIKSKVITFTCNRYADTGNSKMVLLDEKEIAAERICETLYNENIQSLLVEGGARVLEHFISNGLWDEARIFKGFINFRKGVRAPVTEGEEISVMSFETSLLRIIINRNT
ncbi:MAG: bifunctional diaminohydroxyphosphoribosylaminopyrimidine deaminase/5-amino-6-(5-phosphoribosylamino)uracil reductase RibD [Bacteroidales bacterium]